MASRAAKPERDFGARILQHRWRLYELRNRVAHHEPVLHWDLQKHYGAMLRVTRWLSPAAAAWCATYSRFTTVYPRERIVLSDPAPVSGSPTRVRPEPLPDPHHGFETRLLGTVRSRVCRHRRTRCGDPWTRGTEPAGDDGGDGVEQLLDPSPSHHRRTVGGRVAALHFFVDLGDDPAQPVGDGVNANSAVFGGADDRPQLVATSNRW